MPGEVLASLGRMVGGVRSSNKYLEATAAVTGHPLSGKVSSQVRVLIAEDEYLTCQVVRRTVEQTGAVVVGEAANGLQAVAMTRELRPDVVLMDLNMPDMDGIQAAQSLQETCPTPVVVLTACESPEILQRVSESGVGAYLVKPPNAREIDRAITIARARFGDLLKLKARQKELETALARVKILSGLLPICVGCKRIRNDRGYWDRVEHYLQEHTQARFSHSFCPECLKRRYEEFGETVTPHAAAKVALH